MQVSVVSSALIEEVRQEARRSVRKRKHYNFHEPQEAVQRILQVMRRGTYIQPHMHRDPAKVEMFIILEGKVGVVIFTPKGEVCEWWMLDADGSVRSAEIPPGCIHTLVVLSDEAVMMEIIEGPYLAETHKQFVGFAPEERSPEAQDYRQGLESLLEETIASPAYGDVMD